MKASVDEPERLVYLLDLPCFFVLFY
jgi:hypothetical protein